MSSWIKIKGTQTGSFQLGLSGPTLNNNSGNLQLRNSANTANADISVGNVAGNVITGNLLTGTLTTASQPNITSVGTLSSLVVTANANVGNINSGGVANITGNLTSLNANLGNLAIANYITGTLTTASQPNITNLGTLSSLTVTANITTGNLLFGSGVVTGTGNIISGNANLGNLATTNNLSVTTYVTSNLIPNANVTYSLGNSTNRWKDLWLSGNTIQLGNSTISTSGNGLALPSANVTSDLSVGGNATITGNTVIAGNLTVAGTTTYVNSTNTSIADPIIELGGGANGAALLTSDGLDRGTLLHYASGNTARDAFMGWKSANSEFTFASNASVSNNVVTINTLGNIRVNNITGTLTTNAQPNITSVGALTTLMVTGSVNIGNITNLTLYGGSNGQVLTTNGNGVVSWSTVSSGGNSSYGDSNVTSLLTSGNITGNITIGNNTGTYANIELRGIYSKFMAPYALIYNEVGTIAINSSSISNDANLALKSSANVNIQVFTGNAYSNIISVIGDYPSYTNAARVAIAGNVAITGNISATNLGNIVTINKDGNSSNVLYGNGVFAAAPSGGGNIATDYWRTTSKSLTYSSSSQVALLTLPANATVDKVTIIVDTAFNGNSPGATVGRSFGGTGLEYVSTGDVDLKTADRYDLPCQIAPTGNTFDIVINYTASSSTAGSARVLITYAVAS